MCCASAQAPWPRSVNCLYFGMQFTASQHVLSGFKEAVGEMLLKHFSGKFLEDFVISAHVQHTHPFLSAILLQGVGIWCSNKSA